MSTDSNEAISHSDMDRSHAATCLKDVDYSGSSDAPQRIEESLSTNSKPHIQRHAQQSHQETDRSHATTSAKGADYSGSHDAPQLVEEEQDAIIADNEQIHLKKAPPLKPVKLEKNEAHSQPQQTDQPPENRPHIDQQYAQQRQFYTSTPTDTYPTDTSQYEKSIHVNAPHLGDASGVLGRWNFAVGSMVHAGDVVTVVEMEQPDLTTDYVPIRSPANGILTTQHAATNDDVNSDQPLFDITPASLDNISTAVDIKPVVKDEIIEGYKHD
jgi:biotin carboxyl carrier protein